MFKAFGLSHRVVLGSLLLSLSIAAVMGLALRRYSVLLSSTAHLQVADDVLVMGSQIQDDLLELFQTQEVFDQFLSEQTWRHYFEFNQRIETLLGRVKDLQGFRHQRREMETLNRARLEMSDVLQTATYTINPNFKIGAISPDMVARIRTARNRLHQQIRALMVQERQERTNLENLLKVQLEETLTTMFWVVGLVLAGGLGFAFYLHRAAMAPLKSLMEVLREAPEGLPKTKLEPAGAPEMRELIASFNTMNASLEHQQKRLTSMLSLAVTVAHEVRNPIAAIGTAIQALQAGYPPEAPDREIFAEILKEVYRVNTIISDLLVFARSRPLAPEQFSLRGFMDELNILLGAFLQEKHVKLTMTVIPESAECHADKNQLHRAFLNLITNAVDAVGANGEIRWLAETRRDTLLMTFEDSGPGIPESDREKVFDPFFSTKVKGTGLGLAIVFDIIERHHGSIRVTSGQQLSGARFEIEIPQGKHHD
jgi:signal transduction histidine kinase